MVEITGRLSGGRSVFLAGEVVECFVTFSNIGGQIRNGGAHSAGAEEVKISICYDGILTSWMDPGKSSKMKSAKLAWASAQIHCQCSVNENRVTMNDTGHVSSSQLNRSTIDTSFVPFKGEKGATVLSTKPVILFCDVMLLPGESQTFVYKEALPLDAPPSYRGAALKYSYKITIGAQRIGCPTKLVRVPFRVLVVPGLMDTTINYPEEAAEECRPSNPFYQRPRNDNSLLDFALENLQTITCRKSPSFYNITNASGRVAQFCLFKQAFRIGDDVVGTCDFTKGTVTCVQFSVTLQSEEQISESCQKKTVTGVASQGSTITSYSKHDEFCVNMAKTHVSITIPLTATPAFVTDLVSLRWRLHFEFVTSKTSLLSRPEPKSSTDDISWQGPAQLDVETMVWDLPIKVFATNPAFVTSITMLKSKTTCTI